jgi:hypothetical protein
MIIAQVCQSSNMASSSLIRFAGGSLLAAFPEGSATSDFPSMQHGFFNRGDTSNPDIAVEVTRAVTEILSYLGRF